MRGSAKFPFNLSGSVLESRGGPILASAEGVHREVADRCSRIAEVQRDPRALRLAPGYPDRPQSVVVACLAPKKKRSWEQIISRYGQ